MSDTRDQAATVEQIIEEGLRLSRGGAALYLANGSHLDHAEFHRLLNRAEEDLRSLGISRHTRVMTALPDGPLAACVLLVLTRSAVCAPINPDLRAAELEVLLPELGAEMLIAHGSCADEARRVAAALGLPIVEVEFDNNALKWTGSPLPGGPASMEKAEPDDPSLVLLTSGSSARPKRVPLTHRQLTLAAHRMTKSLELGSNDCCLNMMPMFHVGAVVDLLLAPLSVGGSVMRPDTMSAVAFFDAVATGIPTWFQGVPTLLHELTAHGLRRQGSYPQNSLRLVRSVSSPLPPEWFGEIQAALGAPVIEIYGMTETAGIITSNPLPPAISKVGSVGLPTGLEIIIRDADGNSAGANVRGEILVRGAGVMTGYEKMEGSDRGFTADGWLKTGDEGFFDEDGYLFITGRIGDQINRGGEKISPREVDEILVTHPAVKEAAAFPMPHPHLGQEIAAALVLEEGAKVTAESITAHVASRLAHFKVPKTIYLLEQLPRGPGGKLRRRFLPDRVQSVPPLACAPADATEAPQTPMEQKVAEWWQKELGISSITRQGDFFELGGDSLMAASFTVGMEKALGVTVRPAALFDHPTVAAFASYLEKACTQPVSENATKAKGDSPALNPDFHRRLLAAMSVWPGERRDDSSLLVGLRTSGQGMPIFWCGQGRGELDNLVGQIPPQHPIYGTRSLYLFPGKNGKDESALALVFAEEVRTLAAGREIILGGFCAGGRIVLEAAVHLRAQGQRIRMIFLHETVPNRSIDVPVALGICRVFPFSPLSPLRRFDKPELLLNRRCLGGWKWWYLDGVHDHVYLPESLAQEMPKLRSLWENPAGFEKQPLLVQVPGVAYRARIATGRQSLRLAPGSNGVVKVKVTNLSHHLWPAGSVSGLHLGHRWIDAAGKPIGVPGTSIPLPREVPAGDSISLVVKFTAPCQVGQHRLEIDLVDEGVAWFSEKKSQHPSTSLKLTIHAGSRNLFELFAKRS